MGPHTCCTNACDRVEISTLALTVLPKSITMGAPSSAIMMFLQLSAKRSEMQE
jgi:hypothetical protein